MAHIFKHPKGNTKGIIVFSHKEIFHFVKYLKNTRFQSLNRIQSSFLPKDELKGFYKKGFDQLRKKYFVGMHFGRFTPDQHTYDFVDFYMAGEGTVTWLKQAKPFWIPMNSRNFVPSFFRNEEYQNKYWDLITVSSVLNVKNTDVLIREIRKMYDLNKKFKILFVIPSRYNETEERFNTKLLEYYDQNFSYEEKSLFTILKLSPELSFMGISKKQLVHFYNSSKVFTLFSQLEGESRVISEALLCGLPVVVKNDLIGGGRDYLNESNSFYFNEYEKAHLTLIQAIENYSSRIPNNELTKELREDKSIEKLKEYFDDLYQEHNSTFDGELININQLDNRLPSHYNDVKWSLGKFKTADVLSKEQFNIFLSCLELI